jgi:adenylate cyclase
MRISHRFEGNSGVFETLDNEVIFGRPKDGVRVDLDLSPDQKVSRPHGRIWLEDSRFWIEDLGSATGTFVNDEPISGHGRHALPPGATIRVGETELTLETPVSGNQDASSEISKEPEPVILSSAAPSQETFGVAASILDAGQLAIFYELPLQFGNATSVDYVLRNIVEKLVNFIPSVKRAAILMKAATGKDLLLKAHVPLGRPSVSMSLALRAMDTQEGFLWERGEDTTESQLESGMLSGVYAPMVWRGESLGVICVDNADGASQFDSSHLQLLLAVARYASMAVSHQKSEAELRLNSEVLKRLLTNFSPKIREMLLEKARNGRLRLGGSKSEVTLLMSDIRGFTRLSAGMSSEEVVDMLNDYLSAFTTSIFKFDGTVDKFIGDAILAVFGSPQADPNQHENAVRAALEMQEQCDQVSRRRVARGLVMCQIGVGIHSGEVLHGFIGAEDRMEFTVIGDAVNRTARYCAGAAGGQVVISPEVFQRVWRRYEVIPAVVATKHEGDFEAYRVVGAKASATVR